MSLALAALEAFDERERQRREKHEAARHKRGQELLLGAERHFDAVFSGHAPRRELAADRTKNAPGKLPESVLIRAEDLVFRYYHEGHMKLLNQRTSASEEERESVVIDSLATLGQALRGQADRSWDGWE